MSKVEIPSFIDWLEVDTKSISWENKFKDQFLLFWKYTFEKEVQFDEHFLRIRNFSKQCSSGPLKSWLTWLHEAYIVYLFQFYELTLLELESISLCNISEISFFLKNNYSKVKRIDSTILSDFFSIISPQDKNASARFSDLSKVFDIEQSSNYESSDNLKHLEVTLLKNWEYVFEKVPVKKIHFQSSAKKVSIPKQLSFLQELILLFILGGFLILGIKFANKWYEDYLTKEVSLFETQFNWLDKDKVFESKKNRESQIALSYKEIEEIEKKEGDFDIEDKSSLIRYEDESDVVVTSVKSIPQNFEAANQEQSSYEEKKKGGYRDFRYGRRKAYRVMLTAVNPRKLREKLNTILEAYNVSKADNVAPGKKIPGGLYFNLYISRKEIKNFLSEMDEISGATILESKTIFGGPRNMDKVFIWIKEV